MVPHQMEKFVSVSVISLYKSWFMNSVKPLKSKNRDRIDPDLNPNLKKGCDTGRYFDD